MNDFVKLAEYIFPDVTETVSDWGHFTYIKYDGTPYINGTHAVALTCESEDELKYILLKKHY